MIERARAIRTAVARALDDFLALEAGGWKGRAGTAARGSMPRSQPFMNAAVAALAAEGKAQIDRLFVGRQSDRRHRHAAQRRHRAWFWKIAYDEGFARYLARACSSCST